MPDFKIIDNWGDLTAAKLYLLMNLPDSLEGQDRLDAYIGAVYFLSIRESTELKANDPATYFRLAESLAFLATDLPTFPRLDSFEFGGKKYYCILGIEREPLAKWISIERNEIFKIENWKEGLVDAPLIASYMVREETEAAFDWAHIKARAADFEQLPLKYLLGLFDFFLQRRNVLALNIATLSATTDLFQQQKTKPPTPSDLNGTPPSRSWSRPFWNAIRYSFFPAKKYSENSTAVKRAQS